ncbi:MAG: metallophosphoesterase [Alphaproteobacteria bacterium]|nr:metallophosphoesterase [Alphaproteobacteria bacterium]
MRAMWPMVALLVGCKPDPTDPPNPDDTDPKTFRVAFIADSHVIGDDYVCCEGSDLDTESIYRTRRRFTETVQQINAMDPQPEMVFLAGDLFHQNYKWDTVAEYREHGSAAWRAKEIVDQLEPEFHIGWGNHDYDVPEYSREFAHELFRELFDTEPYHAVDRGGFKFLVTNSQLGPTWDSTDPLDSFFDTGMGSFGREQLAWIKAQLEEGKPTFLMFHHPLYVVAHDEDPDGPIPDVFALIEQYRDTIEGVYVGHTHVWIDNSGTYDLPVYVLGSIRYDADNFWVHEFEEGGRSWRHLDFDKAEWGSRYGFPSTYVDGEVAVDRSVPATDDPAGPWDGWTTPPDPWPPEE